MTEKNLIERLRSDHQGHLHAELDRLLAEELERISRHVEQGVEPAVYKAATGWCLALQSARAILARLTPEQHDSPDPG